MADIDKTKDNLKLHELDDFQKKDLFNRFKDSGGEVLSDRQKRRTLAIDRKKQAQYRERLDDHYRRTKHLDKKKLISKSPEIIRNSVNREELVSDFFSRFRIRMRLRLYGVTGFNTVFFNANFFKKFNNDYKKALMEVQLMYFFFFKQDPKTGNRIITRLDKMNSLYYEVIEKIGEIYNQMTIDQLVENYKVFPDVPKAISELAGPLNELFREIYILKPYENSVYSAFEKSIDLYDKLTDSTQKRYKKKDLKNALYIIFHKLYPRLHTLFCYYQNYLFDEIDGRIEDILSILQSEIPGNRLTRRENYFDSSIETSDIDQNSDSNDEEEPTEDLFLKKGITIMSSVNLLEKRRDFYKKNSLSFLDESDIVLNTYLYFLEFEDEYSFILTSNKIKYNIDFSDKERVDYKQRMQDYFNELRKCQESFTSYTDAFETYNKIRSQKPMSQDQYVAYSKRLDDSIRRKDQIGKTVRTTIRKFMEKLAGDLEILIRDMDTKQRYIVNPQEVLQFEYEIEGEKKLNNSKVFEALNHVCSFCYAFVHRLSTGGDLYGKKDFQSNVEHSEHKVENSSSDNSSILSELDDIL